MKKFPNVSTGFRALGSLAILCCMVNVVSADTFGLFTYTDIGSSIEITRYPTTAAGTVDIPANIAGKPVTSIGNSAFSSCKSLTSISIPASARIIMNDAFSNCTGLTSVTMPNGVVTIAGAAFSGCTGLTSFAIPASVMSIGVSTFGYCSKLSAFIVDALNPVYGSVDGILFNKAPTQLIQCPGGKAGIVTVPDSVTDISNYAFMPCRNLTGAYFMGKAPYLASTAFDITASGFKVYYFNGKSGFTSPTWNGYPTVNMGEAAPATSWLIDNNLPYDANLLGDPNGDGVSLLMAYALKLDPSRDLSGSLPLPAFAGNQMGLTYNAGSEGVTYAVQTSTDLQNWSTDGVTLSPPDASKFRTASVAMTGGKRFMRLVVGY